jgi:hypothetical protein
MPAEKRKQPRKPKFYRGQIDAGSGVVKATCNVTELSKVGAKLSLQSPAKLPARFTLVLPDSAKHTCRVVWRSADELGVEVV